MTGSVLNGGTLNPSTAGGPLHITGTYQQTNKGELLSVISGTKPGVQFGQLDVAAARHCGKPHADTGSGFTPGHRQAFAVLVCHNRSGKFAGKSGRPVFGLTYSATAASVVYR